MAPASEFFFAEDYHQQYLAGTKNPYGYCPDHGTGVACPVGVVKAAARLRPSRLRADALFWSGIPRRFELGGGSHVAWGTATASPRD